MLAPSLLTLFAQTPAPISLEWQGGMISLLLIALLLTNVWDKLKRKPPIDDVLDKKLQAQSDQTDKKIDAMDRRREEGDRNNRDLVQERCNSLERVLSDKIADNKTTNSEAFGQLRGELHGVRGSLQSLSNDLMRAIGKLEGQPGRRSDSERG